MHRNHEYELSLLQDEYSLFYKKMMTMWEIVSPLVGLPHPTLRYVERNERIVEMECPIRLVCQDENERPLLKLFPARRSRYERATEIFQNVQTFGDYRVRLYGLSVIDDFMTVFKRACVRIGIPVPAHLKQTRDCVYVLRRQLKRQWSLMSREDETFSHNASKNTLTHRKESARQKLTWSHKKPEDFFLSGNPYFHRIISFASSSPRDVDVNGFQEMCLNTPQLRVGFSGKLDFLPDGSDDINKRAYRIGLKQALEFQQHFARWAKLTLCGEVKAQASHIGFILHRLRKA